MIIKILLFYLIGFIRIEVEGFYIERLMNKCKKLNIFMWNVKKISKAKINCNIGISDFYKLRKICKDTKSKVKIKSKKGLPFIVNRYKKRKIFFGFIFVILISIFTLSNFIWNIEIEGNKDINKDEIFKEIKECGLDIGSLKSKINTNKIIEEIRLKRNDIAWVGIEIRGTNAIVKIVKSTPKPEIIDRNEFCQIVSNKNGVITQIEATNGTAGVKVGDNIKEGDILINGWIEGKYTGIRYVHATGNIKAKITYQKKEEVKYNQVYEKQTGKIENKYSIFINNFQINFNKGLSKFKNYDTINTKKKLKIFNNFYLPIELKKTTNYEKIKQEQNYDLETLKNITTEELEEELKKDIDGKEILNRNVVVEEKEDGIIVELIYEVEENIGVEEKLVF